MPPITSRRRLTCRIEQRETSEYELTVVLDDDPLASYRHRTIGGAVHHAVNVREVLAEHGWMSQQFAVTITPH